MVSLTEHQDADVERLHGQVPHLRHLGLLLPDPAHLRPLALQGTHHRRPSSRHTHAWRLARSDDSAARLSEQTCGDKSAVFLRADKGCKTYASCSANLSAGEKVRPAIAPPTL